MSRRRKIASTLISAAIALAVGLASTARAEPYGGGHGGGGHGGGGHGGRSGGGGGFSHGGAVGHSAAAPFSRGYGSVYNGYARYGAGGWQGGHYGGYRGAYGGYRGYYGGYRGYYGGYRGGYWGYPHFRYYGGPAFVGFGYYYDPYLAWPFLGLATWELADYAYLSEAQMRAQENALAVATTAPLQEPITWSDGPSSGAVIPLREGHTQDGRTCREFQQQITIDGRKQQAFGTACKQPDGSWQIVDPKPAP